MTDSEFLTFIFGRLKNVHKESPYYDYMWRLKGIIDKLKEEGK
jgi:hypothetical protein